MTQVVVVIGGGALHPRARVLVEPGSVVIAADSGLDHSLAAGLEPHRLVGDLDSISVGGQEWANAARVGVDGHPADKDCTDTELALAAATDTTDASRLLLLGGPEEREDRLDHLLGTLLALGNPRLARFDSVQAMLGSTRVAVVHGGRTTAVPTGKAETFSVLALHGDAHGVTVKGAKWELFEATLRAHEARGVSNVSLGDAVVSCRSGVVTVVAP